MERVEFDDAKERLESLVEAASRGEETVILRDGKPVATLGPAQASAVEGEARAKHEEGLAFAKWLLSMPVAMEFERDRTPMRRVDFD